MIRNRARFSRPRADRAGPTSQPRETGPVTAPDAEPGAQPSSGPSVGRRRRPFGEAVWRTKGASYSRRCTRGRCAARGVDGSARRETGRLGDDRRTSAGRAWQQDRRHAPNAVSRASGRGIGGTRGDHGIRLVVGGVARGCRRHHWRRDPVRVAASASDGRFRRDVRDRDVFGQDRGGVWRDRGDRHALWDRAGASFQSSRRSSKANALPSGPRSSSRSCSASQWVQPRRSVWPWDGPSPARVPEPVLLLTLYVLIGKQRRSRKDDRHHTRSHRRHTNRDRRAARAGNHRYRRRSAPPLVRGALQEILALLRPVHIRARSRSRPAGARWRRGSTSRL